MNIIRTFKTKSYCKMLSIADLNNQLKHINMLDPEIKDLYDLIELKSIILDEIDKKNHFLAKRF